MRILGAQFNRLSGPDITSSYKIEFIVDEANRDCLSQILELKKGTEVLLMMYTSGEDDQEMNEMVVESKDDTRRRLNRQMHAKINEIAKNKNVSSAEVKKKLKEYLIRKKLMKESSKELNVNGLASAIYYLQTEFSK